MGKIYSPPQEIGKQPEIGGINFNFNKYERECKAYISRIVAYAKKHGTGVYAGEEIRFGVADGYARYIVVSLTPVKLIHIPTGDAWQFPYVNRLTAKDIKEQISGR